MPMPLHVCLQVKRNFLNSACSSSAFEHHASTLDVLNPDMHMQVEGTCSGKYGFLICVTGMGDVSKGQIREGLGTALFNVHYSCLVLRPHKGEVMDCVVTSVSKVCAAWRNLRPCNHHT